MKSLEKIVNSLSNTLLPIAAKIGGMRDLVAIRDGFAAIMPVILAGAFATLLNNVIFQPTSLLGTAFYPEGIPFFTNVMVPIMSNIWWGTLAVMSLILVSTVTYSLVNSYGKPAMPAAAIALAAYLTMTSQTATFTPEGADAAVTGWGYINWAALNANNVFAALIIGLTTAHIYVWFVNKKLVIKMPASVPPAVSNAFIAIVPGIVIITLAGIIAQIFFLAGTDIFTWITTTLQQPFMGFSQGLGFALVYVVLIQIFWFFGIHGGNIMSVVTNGVYLPALVSNADVIATGVGEAYVFTSAFFDAFVHIGGAGATLALMIAVFIGSKREDTKAIAKLATPAAVFQINEPIMFGMPVVLNVLIAIPFIITPIILTVIAWFATVSGFIPETYVVIPWVTPVGIGAYLATGGSLTAMLVAFFNLFVAVIIYLPFIMVSNKQKITIEE